MGTYKNATKKRYMEFQNQTAAKIAWIPLYRKKNESPYRNKLCYKYLVSVYGIVTDEIFLWN